MKHKQVSLSVASDGGVTYAVKPEKKHNRLFISLTAVFTVLIAAAVFLTVWFAGDRYKDFENNFRKEFSIPGLKDGAVPQGMGVYSADTENYYLITAYMTDGSPSRIYVTGSASGYLGYVTMKNADGTDYVGHCGGIATNGYTLWVTGESAVYCAKADADYQAKSKNIGQEIVERASGIKLDDEEPEKCIRFTATFKANCGADFCYYYDNPSSVSLSYDKLYVGEFYRKGKWDTDKSHRVTTPKGYKNTAFMYEYSIDNGSEYGLTRLSDSTLDDGNKVPRIQKIYSIPEKIQGVAFSGRTGSTTNGTLVLSQSYGLANSSVICFDWNRINAAENGKPYKELTGINFTYEGVKTITNNNYTDKSVTVYFADMNDKAMLTANYSIPSMSEGMFTLNNRVYVLFENAGKKYKLFTREKLKNVYSFLPRS